MGALLEHFGCTFRVKTQTGAPKVPQEAPPQKFPNPFGHLGAIIFIHFRVFYVKKCVLETCCVFSRILGRIERSWGWAHMQSVHACAVQTHFSVFDLVLKKGSLKSVIWVNLAVIFHHKCDFCVKIGVPKTASKNVLLPGKTTTYSGSAELPERQPRVRTVQTRNSCSSSS